MKILKNTQSFQFQFKKKLQELIEMEKKLVLLIILLKEFIKLNVNMDTMIKNVKLAESNRNIATVP